MRRKRIALIYGGAGAEHEVSLMGAEHLLGLIDREKYIPYPILITKGGAWLAEGDPEREIRIRLGERGGTLTEGDKAIPIAAAFPLLHGDFGEDGCVQGLLECARIPYVGSRVTAGALSADKILTKDVARTLGIPVARGVEITDALPSAQAMSLAEGEVGYPMFIKPSGLGSSVGAHAVFCRDEFAPAYLDATECGTGRVLIEEYIEDKREIECAYLSYGGRDIFTHPGEILSSGFYDYSEKYSEDSRTKTLVRADIPKSVAERIIRFSRMLVLHIGIRHLARIDFFLSGTEVLFNEVNTMPGFTASSLYPALIGELGISGTELITSLIEGAIGR